MDADHSEILKLEKRLEFYTKKLSDMSNKVAEARQVREYSNETLKRALSIGMKKFLEEGEAVSAAEHKSRASDEYGAALFEAKQTRQAAEETIAEYAGAQCGFEAARSLLSLGKMKLERV